jgi:hypothetical protein
MTTPGEPFAEAAGEAVQTSVMAVRLVLAIADAVRRQRQRNAGKEQEVPPADQAVSETAEDLKKLFPEDISGALMSGADWSQMAQQLLALRQAGVNLDDFLPRVSEIAVNVRDQVAANAERVAREGTGEWERMLRETLPAGMVREAMLSSEGWPDIAASMARLDEAGVDVRGILASAHDEGLGVDQAVAKALAAGVAPVTSQDALHAFGPLTTGLDIPSNLDLSDRPRAMRQLSLGAAENSRCVRWLTEAMPGREREAALLVNQKLWPLLVAQMVKMDGEGQPVRQHLERLVQDTSWEKGDQPMLGSRLVQAANEALRRPVGDGSTQTSARVNTAAARAQSPSMGPTNGQAKSATPAEPGVAAHRQAGPAPTRTRNK